MWRVAGSPGRAWLPEWSPVHPSGTCLGGGRHDRAIRGPGCSVTSSSAAWPAHAKTRARPGLGDPSRSVAASVSGAGWAGCVASGPMGAPVLVDEFLPLPWLHHAVPRCNRICCHIVAPGAIRVGTTVLAWDFTSAVGSVRGCTRHRLRRRPHTFRGMMHPMQLRALAAPTRSDAEAGESRCRGRPGRPRLPARSSTTQWLKVLRPMARSAFEVKISSAVPGGPAGSRHSRATVTEGCAVRAKR
jgi:hypothetical protein